MVSFSKRRIRNLGEFLCFWVDLRSTSSAEKNFPDEITWITWKKVQNLEIWPSLNSRLEMWVWASGQKNDPATSVTPVAGSIFGPLSQTHFSKSEFKNPQLIQWSQSLSTEAQWAACSPHLLLSDSSKAHTLFHNSLSGLPAAHTFFCIWKLHVHVYDAWYDI